MDRGIRIFWVLVLTLLSASVVFGVGAERRRREITDTEAALVTGDIVHFNRVVDGDSVLVDKDGKTVSVRILGIKAFVVTERGAGARFGNAAKLRLERLLEDKPIRVLLHSTPRDKHGRFLAELCAEDVNVGLELVKEGLALVYSVYPFPSMSLYLTEQAHAKAELMGLWADPDTAERARLLEEKWSKE